MGNRRVILFLLAGIAVCIALLVVIQRRERYFPVAGQSRTELIGDALTRIRRMTVDHGVARIGLVKQGNRWGMTAPFAAHVDQGTVARILDGFEQARVTDALAFQEIRQRELSFRDFGLAPPRTQVELGGDESVLRFQFGAKTPLGTDVYVRLDGLDQMLTVPASLYDALPRTADDLRSRRLAHGDRSRIRSLELRMPGHPFIKLQRESGTWRLTQPLPGPAADARVETLLDLLFAEQIQRHVWPTVSNVMDVAESEAAVRTRQELFGLGRESGIQVQIERIGGEQPERVIFGRRLDGRDDLSYVLLPGTGSIGAVSNHVVEAWRIKPDDLRDPRIFADFKGVIQRVQLYVDNTRYALARSRTGWRMESPVADVADEQGVTAMLDQLMRLEAEAMHDPVEGDAVTSEDARDGEVLCHLALQSDQKEIRCVLRRHDRMGTWLQIALTNMPTAYLVASSNVPSACLNKEGVISLRDKTILALPEDCVRRVTLRRADGTQERLVREKGDAAWRADRETPGVPAQAHVAGLLHLLSGLRASRIEKLGTATDDATRYGFQEPWLEVGVDVDTADAVRKTVILGARTGGGQRFAALRGLDVVFVLDPDAIETLSAPLLESR